MHKLFGDQRGRSPTMPGGESQDNTSTWHGSPDNHPVWKNGKANSVPLPANDFGSSRKLFADRHLRQPELLFAKRRTAVLDGPPQHHGGAAAATTSKCCRFADAAKVDGDTPRFADSLGIRA